VLSPDEVTRVLIMAPVQLLWLLDVPHLSRQIVVVGLAHGELHSE
jgi:hypothetical protein